MNSPVKVYNSETARELATKYHLKLEIKSDYLNSLTKLKAQRAIMKLLTKELNTKIHALEIKIK